MKKKGLKTNLKFEFNIEDEPLELDFSVSGIKKAKKKKPIVIIKKTNGRRDSSTHLF